MQNTAIQKVMSEPLSITSCHDCGLLQKTQHMPEDGAVKCCRCIALLRQRQRIAPEQSIEHSLALVITAIVLLILANVFPILHLQVGGHEMSATLFAGVQHFLDHDMKLLAGLVFITSIGAPMLQLGGLLYVLLPLYLNHVPWQAPHVYRFIRMITSWSMLEVFMLGILVSIVKLAGMATVTPGIGLWAFGILIFLIAAIIAGSDAEIIWDQISAYKRPDLKHDNLGQTKMVNCHNCNLLTSLPVDAHNVCCPRCDSPLHFRKPDSLVRSSALLIAAIVLFIPANLLPMMVVTNLGSTEGDTIMSGVIYLLTSGDWPLALVIFIASVFVPSIKLIILSFLQISVYLNIQWNPNERTRLYRLTEAIGRWSMVDIFVVTLMAALIQIQGIAEIEAGLGALAFGAVVVLTLLSAMAFDPRLIWDKLESPNG